MKINKTILSVATLLSLAAALCACSSNKKIFHSNKDCSKVFDSTNPAGENSADATECRVLPIKISKDAKCEISGSNSIDNFTKTLDQNNPNQSILVIPVSKLAKSMSYSDMLKLYFVTMKIKERVDSDLFNELKDYRYKGLKCEVKGKKLVAWIGKDKAIAVMTEQEEFVAEVSKSYEQPKVDLIVQPQIEHKVQPKKRIHKKNI